jgi:hypothetical protein
MGGVFKTINGGDTWSAVNSGLPHDPDFTDDYLSAATLAINPQAPSILYVGLGSGPGSETYPDLEGGVYRSTNGGGSWSIVGSGLTDFTINALAIDPVSPASLYAATAGGGVYGFQLMPVLVSDHTSGAPGSYFTFTGYDFPPDDIATIEINGISLGTVPTDASGQLIFILQTSATAEEGSYRVTATVGSSASTRFSLTAGGVVHPQDGAGTVFDVPDGIAYIVRFLPLLVK